MALGISVDTWLNDINWLCDVDIVQAEKMDVIKCILVKDRLLQVQ